MNENQNARPVDHEALNPLSTFAEWLQKRNGGAKVSENMNENGRERVAGGFVLIYDEKERHSTSIQVED